MTEETFTADDLLPDPSIARRSIIDRAATTVAVMALGLWAGGMIALGACAAPFVFDLTPFPFSGQAMSSAFVRFDSIAITCGVVALGCEVVRTALRWRNRQTISMRIRRIAVVIMTALAMYGGMVLSPQILAHAKNRVRRHIGPEGADLERLHKQAEFVGKVNVPLAALVIALHIFTLGASRDEDD